MFVFSNLLHKMVVRIFGSEVRRHHVRRNHLLSRVGFIGQMLAYCRSIIRILDEPRFKLFQGAFVYRLSRLIGFIICAQWLLFEILCKFMDNMNGRCPFRSLTSNGVTIGS